MPFAIYKRVNLNSIHSVYIGACIAVFFHHPPFAWARKQALSPEIGLTHNAWIRFIRALSTKLLHTSSSVSHNVDTDNTEYKIPQKTTNATSDVKHLFGRIFGVKLGSYQGTDMDWGNLTIGCWGEYLDVWRKKWEEDRQTRTNTVKPRLTKIIRSGVTFVGRNLR